MLETVHLTKVYRPKRGQPVKALDDVSLRFPKKGMVFILGRSGSGKSTLLNLLGGLDRADGGEILIRGVSTSSFKQHQYDSYRNTYIGFVFQDFRLIPEMTAKQNIQLPLMLDGKKLDKDYFNSLCERLMIQDRLYHLPSQLSGGQKQRVAIARALITNPDVILCDEPTGNLDSKSGSEVIELLKHICENDKKTLIIVTHDEKLATKLDRIIKIYDSEVIE